MSKQPPVPRGNRPSTTKRPAGNEPTPGVRPTRASSTGIRPPQNRSRSRRLRRPWWRGPVPIASAVILVIIVVIAFVVLGNQGSSGSAEIGKPAPASLVAQVTSVSPSVIAAVGKGKLSDGTVLPNLLKANSGAALTLNGKPELLYIGGEFCPICAVERWSMVNALSRFGTISNLHYMRSADTDLNLATFTFVGSSYTSKYISFLPIENEDRNHNQLQALSSAQAQLLSSLGNNSYPFIDVAGAYTQSGAYGDTELSGKSWAQIAAALSNPSDPITQLLVGNANYLTATICKVTHNQPSNVCGTATIKALL